MDPDVNSDDAAATTPPAPQAKPRQYTLVYSSIFVLSYWHLAALYGLFLSFTAAKSATLLFNVFVHVIGAWGITTGAHRLWSHRAYKAKLPLQVLLMLFQTLMCQKTVLNWCRDHSINSVAHKFGNKPYDKNISPTQMSLPLSLALSSFGEGYHNYHHVFPFDYRVSELGNNYFNFTTNFIDFFAWIGWAYELKYASQKNILDRKKRTGDGTDLWGRVWTPNTETMLILGVKIVKTIAQEDATVLCKQMNDKRHGITECTYVQQKSG